MITHQKLSIDPKYSEAQFNHRSISYKGNMMVIILPK